MSARLICIPFYAMGVKKLSKNNYCPFFKHQPLYISSGALPVTAQADFIFARA
jgi:hypothetical protein